MKILQTPARFYPYVGGVENYVYYLSRELVKLGHEVKVVCAAEPGLGDGEMDGVVVQRLHYFGKIANTNITPILPLCLLEEDFDVIHTHLPTPWSSDWSVLVSAVKRKPLVLTYHNDIVGEGITDYIAGFYNATALKFLLKKAKKIIMTHSRYLKFSPRLRNYEEKVVIVPPGVDVERFHPDEVEVEDTIFFLGVLDEFHKYKGLDYLLEALKLVKKEITRVKLRIGGAGKLLEYYKGRAVSLGLVEHVDFLGHVPRDKTPEYYRECNLFALPSISAAQEGFGMVLLEAMACGKPIVGTSVAGVAEDVRKHNAGIIIEPKDPAALAEAVIGILQDKEEAEKMGAKGRRLVEEKYAWSSVASKIEGIYQGIVV
jgi:glycosyltransferase involved in cell wall biosynthesis